MLTRLRSLSLAAAGALAFAGLGVGTANSAQAATWVCGPEVHSSWGGGQLCTNVGVGWRVRTRDEASDGYCVQAKYYSEDSSSWRNTSPSSQECNGVWKTTVIGTQPYSSGVRLYRGDGRYLTLPR